MKLIAIFLVVVIKIVARRVNDMKKFLTSPTIGFALPFFDELMFDTLDSIDWQSFKVADQLKKEWQRANKIKKMSEFLTRLLSYQL